jgi:hypothetical protein
MKPKYIALGLVGPSDAYWLTTDWRKSQAAYDTDQRSPTNFSGYIGTVPVSGYFCLMRLYPDKLDQHIAGIIPKPYADKFSEWLIARMRAAKHEHRGWPYNIKVLCPTWDKLLMGSGQ